MSYRIIDTNVPLIGSGVDESVSTECMLQSARIVRAVLERRITVVVDSLGDVLSEYRANMYPDPDPSASLAGNFLMHLIDNREIPDCVRNVNLPRESDGAYLDYPDSDDTWTTGVKRCERFDPDDKKWVALALRFKRDTGEDAPIVNAADRCWLAFESQLEAAGVKLECLCLDEREAASA